MEETVPSIHKVYIFIHVFYTFENYFFCLFWIFGLLIVSLLDFFGFLQMTCACRKEPGESGRQLFAPALINNHQGANYGDYNHYHDEDDDTDVDDDDEYLPQPQ